MKSFKEYCEKHESYLDPGTESFMAWHSNFEKQFPIGDYNRSTDRYNLMVGRIHNILDYFGETKNLDEYVGNLKRCEANYIKLLHRYVQKFHPEMYNMWRQEYPETN